MNPTPDFAIIAFHPKSSKVPPHPNSSQSYSCIAIDLGEIIAASDFVWARRHGPFDAKIFHYTQKKLVAIAAFQSCYFFAARGKDFELSRSQYPLSLS
jgi:hypothetical protein